MKSLTNRLIYILLGIVIILSEIYIAEYYYDMYQAKKQSKLLDEISLNENVNSENIVRNENDSKANPTIVKSERILKLEELQKENEDIVAWMEIEGTNINYPVLQGNDNDYYMNHNYKKSYSKSGSIFLDKDCSFFPLSTNLLIYGHNMKNGTMFGDLLKYEDKKYFESHSNIRFTTNIEDSVYEIISVFKSKVYYTNEKNVFRYYYFINADSQAEFDDYINNIKKSSLYDTGRSATFR